MKQQWIDSIKTMSVAFGLASISSLSLAAIQGLHFSHKDWEMACDNTGTCRAAGYQADQNFDQPVSVLLERVAGANTAVTGKVQILASATTKPIRQLQMQIANKSYGVIALDPQGIGQLSSTQTRVFLKAVQGTSPVVFKHAQSRWTLSTAGASAVLLKMDEFQRRLSTPSALIKPGKKSSQAVLKAAAIPQIVIPKYQSGKITQAKLNTAAGQQMIRKLQATTNEDQCDLLFSQHFMSDDVMTIYPINAQNQLIQIPCWRGAYNMGSGFWLIDQNKQPRQLVTTSGETFSQGQIFSGHKVRGLGDCLSQDEWAWDDKAFVKSFSSLTVQCKGFAGGAWNLPTYVSKVIPLK
ncbi:DUF1176 domain-containing protein [Acinetobacter pseudolwoffii]|uniref:DUF1176 domain-containing protein n=1 Tax=Acinetobacter pseudolwoffii TaxID=2053287 RepID=A0A2H9YQ06_9GAMM|nr:DUF1176 domain-containing protein [Acinetobacter pseudolwoffii]PJO74734.1 DUF1176 domain-containing protein [Acinetobacter pseudolwoffii]